MAKYGPKAGRVALDLVGVPLADAATFRALPIDAKQRVDGSLTLKLDDATAWMFDEDGAAPAGPGVLEPTTGAGQWRSVGGGGGGAGMPALKAVRAASQSALAAYTRVGNVITADGNGALAAQDGVTLIATDRYLLKDGAAGADNGVYQMTAAGTAGTPYSFTRVGDADASAEVVSGMLVFVSEGTADGNEWYGLTTDAAITLNTTALTFTKMPSGVDLASVANGEGASLVGLEDAGAFTTAADAEAALAELYQHIITAQLEFPSTSLYDLREVSAGGDVGAIAANGGLLASDTDPALQGDAAESQEVTWVAANTDLVAMQIPVPLNLDSASNVTVELDVYTGNTNADAATFTVETSWNGAAVVVDTATDAAPSGTVHTISATIAAADVPASARRLTLMLTPGAHATDNVVIVGIKVLGTGALRTS